MAKITRLERPQGTTVVDFEGGTLQAGTVTLRVAAGGPSLPPPTPYVARSTSRHQKYGRQALYTFPDSRTISVPVVLKGGTTAQIAAALRDIHAVMLRGDGVLVLQGDTGTTLYADLLRSPSFGDLLDDFRTNRAKLTHPIVLTFEAEPFLRPSSTATITATAANFAGGAHAGLKYLTLAAASGDVPPPALYTLTKSAAADDVSKLWVGFAEVALGTYAAEVLADSPVGWWRLGESAGTSAADASGNGRTGTYDNAPTLAQAGALSGDADTAVRFTVAQSEKVTVADHAALRFSAAFSLECWVKLTAASGTNGLISKGTASDTNGAYDLYISDGSVGQIAFQIRQSGAGQTALTANVAALAALGWVHIAATYDEVNQVLYANGVEVGRRADTGGIDTSALALFLGARNVNGTAVDFLGGTLDEPAVYNRALSAAEVAEHYQVGAGTSPHLAFYNPGTGGTGATWTDGTGMTDQTDATAISSGAGAIVRWTPTSTNDESLGYFTIPAQTPGWFHCFLIAKQTGGAIGDITLHVKVADPYSPTTQNLSSTRKRAPVVGAWAWWDLGLIKAPLTAADGRLYVYGKRDTGSATIDLDAVILMAVPAADTNVDDLSGGECFVSNGVSVSTAGHDGPIKIDGTQFQPTATIDEPAGSPRPMILVGDPPKLSAGQFGKTMHVLVICAKSDGSSDKAVGVSALTAEHAARYLTLA